MRRSRLPATQDLALVVALGSDYWVTTAPQARRELRNWARRARVAPNDHLRGLALQKLSAEALNPEAAAFFAILAPRANRHALVRLLVAYQTMYDYLDAVNEQPGATPLHNGQQLHRALTPCAQDGTGAKDNYAYNPQIGDAGYLKTLARAWRACLQKLPSAAVISDALNDATKRCAEGQARNHAIVDEGYPQLSDWAEQQAQRGEYHWWELAAAGISCLAIHALFAAAAAPHTTAQEARQITNAYFPDVCAISSLLDSLIDYPRDMQIANHSFIAHYHSQGQAAARHATIIRRARTSLESLDRARCHRLILAGLVAYYFSTPEAARSLAVSAIDQAAPRDVITRAAAVIMRARRRHRSCDAI